MFNVTFEDTLANIGSADNLFHLWLQSTCYSPVSTLMHLFETDWNIKADDCELLHWKYPHRDYWYTLAVTYNRRTVTRTSLPPSGLIKCYCVQLFQFIMIVITLYQIIGNLPSSKTIVCEIRVWKLRDK